MARLRRAAVCGLFLLLPMASAHGSRAAQPPADTDPAAAEPAAIQPAATQREASYRDFRRRPTVLSEVEAEQVGHQVRARCGIKPDSRHLPWYYYYELGLTLAKRGDAQRALDALVEATDRRSQPEHRAFMYGMWFIDYLPYFEIAKLHHELGNSSCAWDALRLSRQYGEVAENQPASKRRRELVQALQNRLLREDEP
jgi:hypothetical protein